NVPGGNVIINQNTSFLDASGLAGMRFSAGTLTLSPSGSGADVDLPLNTGTATANGQFLLNAGGTLVLNKGTNNSVTAEINVLLRTTGSGSSGSLVITPASGVANFGIGTAAGMGGENLRIYNGSFHQANINGMIVPTVAVQASGSDSSGDFVNYNGGD